MSETRAIDRRDFVKVTVLAGSGLLLGVSIPDDRAWVTASASLQPNAFVQIDPGGTVSIWVGRSEMGQGVRTALPMIVADELDADWSSVKVVQADAHPSSYGSMRTVGSTSVRGRAWTALRQAGASAREMLVAAAAAQLAVPASSLRTESGYVVHDASGRRLSYGELTEAASALPVPTNPRLKDPSEFTLIGTSPHMIDTPDIVTGRATFGVDARTPGMLFGTVVRPAMLGGSLGSFDATPAREVSGVIDVFEVSSGIAVVAENTWAAFQGAQALDVTWLPGDFTMSSPEISATLRELAGSGEPAVAIASGEAEKALAGASSRIRGTYEAPFLAHATMEPMNATADVRPDRCEVWAPSQSPQSAQSTAATLTGLPIEAVTVHVTRMGCGWGRRGRTDYVEDAVEASMHMGAPVQILWTREEDMRNDFYRPTSYSEFEGGLDADGRLAGLKARVVATPINYANYEGGGFGGGRRGGSGGVDRSSVDGIATVRYDLPDFLVDYVRPDIHVPTGHWRSVGPSQSTFMFESFIDELAHAGGRDPVDFRRELLNSDTRLRHVLDVAVQASGWGTPLPEGRARGVALVLDKGGRVAQVAEVSLQGGQVRVHRVTCAADCGTVIHPQVVEGQLVGAIVGGLTAALYGEITIQDGRVEQDNFDSYQMLRMQEMPEVDVHLVPSDEEPGGAGEPGVPPIAPAVTNALFALTGVRIRKLPIQAEALARPDR